MLAVLITLTPRRENEFIDCQKAEVPIEVLPIVDVKPQWKSTLQMIARVYQLRELTRERLKNPQCSNYRPLFTTPVEWAIMKYVMEVWRPFRHWTLWMSKQHTGTRYHIIPVYNNLYDHMEGIMRASAKKLTQLKYDLYSAMMFARQKLSQYYAGVTPTTGILLISPHILHRLRKLWSFRR